MVPFNIRLKANSNGDKMTRYIELNVNENTYRLLPKLKLSVDGVTTSVPYQSKSNGIKIYRNGKVLELETDFGLKLRWTGVKTEIKLCQLYAHLVCGLCGRGVYYKASRKNPNEYLVDRNNEIIRTGKTYAQREFNWIGAWRVPDDSKDAPAQ